MAHSDEVMRAEALEREIEQDRRRIEEKIGAIQAKMSPGQLVDEALSWAKSNGATEYASNLGSAMKTNPIPVALMGIGMAWLMANPGRRSTAASEIAEETEYPLAPVHGSTVRRIGPVQADGPSRYSHFADEAGNRFKALTDESGHRAGHFMDQAGRSYRGFADATGKQVRDIRDETGKLFDEATGWLSGTWRRLGQAASNATGAMMHGARSGGHSTMAAGNALVDQALDLNHSMMRHFRDQPLIGGALAFALGAAIGAALPNTRREDELMGDMAEGVRDQISTKAVETRAKAEQVASEVYEKAQSVASEVHDVAKQRLTEEAKQYQRSNNERTPPNGAY